MTNLPSISMPNGASFLPDQLIPSLEKFSKIYLWMDHDLAGNEAAKKFSEKLGHRRCGIINPTNL